MSNYCMKHNVHLAIVINFLYYTYIYVCKILYNYYNNKL